MWEILTGEDPYDGMHYGGVIGMHLIQILWKKNKLVC